jgi:hypothetical protein
MMLRGQEDNSLLGWFDDISQHVQQQRQLVIRTALQELQLERVRHK